MEDRSRSLQSEKEDEGHKSNRSFGDRVLGSLPKLSVHPLETGEFAYFLLSLFFQFTQQGWVMLDPKKLRNELNQRTADPRSHTWNFQRHPKAKYFNPFRGGIRNWESFEKGILELSIDQRLTHPRDSMPICIHWGSSGVSVAGAIIPGPSNGCPINYPALLRDLH